jgi:toxin ParE1/3/4
MNRVIIRRVARADARSIKTWYENERKALGHAFVLELDGIVERIRLMPLQFPDVYRGYRRALLNRFPYAVYFRVTSESSVAIFAILHQHQNPAEWKRRVRLEEDAG